MFEVFVASKGGLDMFHKNDGTFVYGPYTYPGGKEAIQELFSGIFWLTHKMILLERDRTNK